MEVAAQLRRKIEGHLQIKGLSPNHKNAIPPSMTRFQAREWVTDNRAGFGFSGPLSEMPVIEFMDPLADAGDIDRRTALGLLFDPELDDLRDPERILRRVGLALQASETRFGDKATRIAASGKAIVTAHLGGADGRAKVERWVPRWMAFPPAAYTGRGGVGTIRAHARVLGARPILPEPEQPVEQKLAA